MPGPQSNAARRRDDPRRIASRLPRMLAVATTAAAVATIRGVARRRDDPRRIASRLPVDAGNRALLAAARRPGAAAGRGSIPLPRAL